MKNRIVTQEEVRKTFNILYKEFIEKCSNHYYGEIFNEESKSKLNIFFDKSLSISDCKSDQITSQDNIITEINSWWISLINAKRYNYAIKFWEELYQLVLEWESKRNQEINKGSLFYFWAVSYLHVCDIDRAFILVNQAYLEDDRLGNPNMDNFPAASLLKLKNTQNVLSAHIRKVRRGLINELKLFNEEFKIKFKIENLEESFLGNPKYREQAISFVHSFIKFKTLSSEFNFNRNEPQFNSSLSHRMQELTFSLAKIAEIFVKDNAKESGCKEYSITKKAYKHLFELKNDFFEEKDIYSILNDSNYILKIIKLIYNIRNIIGHEYNEEIRPTTYLNEIYRYSLHAFFYIIFKVKEKKSNL